MVKLESEVPTNEELVADTTQLRQLTVMMEPQWLGPVRSRLLIWTLGARGYRFQLVNEELPEILGHKTIAKLERLPERYETALIARSPEGLEKLLRECYQNGISTILLVRTQPDETSLQLADELNLQLILDHKPLYHLPPVPWIWQMMGRLLKLNGQ